MNVLIWNISSVNTQKAFTRLINMHKRYQFCFIGLMEPFHDKQGLEVYRRKLDIKHAVANINGKIIAFVDEILEVEVLRDEEKQITVKL